jgi:hypothetical protein
MVSPTVLLPTWHHKTAHFACRAAANKSTKQVHPSQKRRSSSGKGSRSAWYNGRAACRELMWQVQTWARSLSCSSSCKICKLNSHRHQYNIKIISIIHKYTTIISTWLSHDTSVAWSWDTGMELGGPHVHAHWDESVSKQPNAGHQQWGSSMRISRKKHKKTLDFGTK